MFKWLKKQEDLSFMSPNEQGVISRNGYSFYSVDLYHFEYSEDDHIASIVVERGDTKILYLENIKWNPPHENEVISEHKKTEIIQNITNALNFMGRKYYLRK